MIFFTMRGIEMRWIRRSIAKVDTNADKLPHFFAVYPATARVGRRAILLGHFARSAVAGAGSAPPPSSSCPRPMWQLHLTVADAELPFFLGRQQICVLPPSLPSFLPTPSCLPSLPSLSSPSHGCLPKFLMTGSRDVRESKEEHCSAPTAAIEHSG